MKILSTYRVKISNAPSEQLKATTEIYRRAVSFFMTLILKEWENVFVLCTNGKDATTQAERLCHATRKRPVCPYDFDKDFYKFPSYLRRSAIALAYGTIRSYKTRLAQWETNPKGKQPGLPKIGREFPALYREGSFVRTDRTHAKIKVWVRNTWDWITVNLKKSDVDYIALHCVNRKECVPALSKRGKLWYLDFAFEEKVKIRKTPIENQLVLGVDLGLNNACTCSAIKSDGTIVGRHFLSLAADKDSLTRAQGKIKRAQRHGAKKMPRLWAKAKGINKNISAKTAEFIMQIAKRYDADVICFEHLELKGKKKGGNKERLHHWKAQEVQRIVTDRAHRIEMSVRHVCAWNTSKLAYDGSGVVTRDSRNHSLCTFATGKKYNCDLSASYNIGARYFIRALMESKSARTRQLLQAKVPEVAHRITCTLSSLRSLTEAIAEVEKAKTQTNSCAESIPF